MDYQLTRIWTLQPFVCMYGVPLDPGLKTRMSGLDSRDVEMRRCRTAGRVDDRASDSLPTRPKGNGSLSGRARERRLLVGKGER